MSRVAVLLPQNIAPIRRDHFPDTIKLFRPDSDLYIGGQTNLTEAHSLATEKAMIELPGVEKILDIKSVHWLRQLFLVSLPDASDIIQKEWEALHASRCALEDRSLYAERFRELRRHEFKLQVLKEAISEQLIDVTNNRSKGSNDLTVTEYFRVAHRHPKIKKAGNNCISERKDRLEFELKETLFSFPYIAYYIADRVKTKELESLARFVHIPSEGKERTDRLEEIERLSPELKNELDQITPNGRAIVIPQHVIAIMHKLQIRHRGIMELADKASTAIDPKSGCALYEDSVTFADQLEIFERRLQRYLTTRDLFTSCNLLLVPKQSKKFKNQSLSYGERITSGNSGLLTAVDMFERQLGFAFSTYAKDKIYQAIQEEVTKGKEFIHIPSHHRSKFPKLMSEANRGMHIQERTTIDYERLIALGYDENTVYAFRTNGLQPQGFGNFGRRYNTKPTNEDTWVEQSLEDKRSSRDITNESSDGLRKLFRKLEKNERKILELRFGLGKLKGKTHTLPEIGLILGITGERARQLQNRALRKLAENNAKRGNILEGDEKDLERVDAFIEMVGKNDRKWFDISHLD